MSPNPTIHATAVLVGARAVLIRGPAGSGKSRLALTLIQAAQQGHLPFARLVADDRVALEAHHGRVLARAPTAIAGRIEVRGLGIRRIEHEAMALVGVVIDLAAADAERLPSPSAAKAEVAGLWLPRLAVAPGADPLPLLLAHLDNTQAAA